MALLVRGLAWAYTSDRGVLGKITLSFGLVTSDIHSGSCSDAQVKEQATNEADLQR